MTRTIETSASSFPQHVLVVDDDEFMLELIADMLRDLGVASITTATDGAQGFAAFQSAKQALNVVICDLNMPNTDGFQMMEMLAKENKGCGFILISGLDQRYMNSATLMAKFHHLNILGALSKPVEKQALANLLSKWRRVSAA